MHTMILLLVVSNVYLLIYLATKIMPEWFMGARHSTTHEIVYFEIPAAEPKNLQIFNDALPGASSTNHKPHMSEAGREIEA